MKKMIALILAVMFVFSAGAMVLAQEHKNIKKGDLNGNGKIDVSDYILTKRAYFNTYILDDLQQYAADINDSGELEMIDYILLKRMYFGTYALTDNDNEASIPSLPEISNDEITSDGFEQSEDISGIVSDEVSIEVSDEVSEDNSDNISSDLSPEGTSSEITSSDESSIEETSSDEVPPFEEPSSEATSSDETTSEETDSDGPASEDTSSEDTSSEDTSSDDTSSEDTSSEDTSSDDTISSEEGIKPISRVISYDKTYTYSANTFTNQWGTSTDADACLTDGAKEYKMYYNPRYVGFSTSYNGIVTIVMDLEGEYYADKFAAYTYGGIDSISNPLSVSVEVSLDKQTWTSVGEGEQTTQTAIDDWDNVGTLAKYVVIPSKSVKARYVRFSFVAGSNFLVLDELEVYGYSVNATVPDEDTSNDDASIPEEDTEVNTTGEDILLCYVAESWKDVSVSKSEFLPSVGYMVNGEYKDYMFDSYIFLCQPNYLYDWNADGSAYLKPLTKDDWTDYITNYEFKANRNINALDTAVGEVKAALGDRNHKAKVYMTLFYPVETVSSFGVVDGKNLDFSKLEDRYLGIKWMVDESIRQFNSHNYENIELAGFYWFCEEIYDESGEGKAIAKYITDYIRSLGMKTTWCPYFYAHGYTEWEEMGFDIATMQANYFPEHRTDWPNKGDSSRLPLVAQASKRYGLGVGMEMADEEVASAEIFKEYMQAGINHGFMNTNHIYYMSTGPEVVNVLANSTNSILRTTYDELYKFIKGRLTSDDITWQ